eukprot:TRINITY_DN152_c0_g1_i1.p1 TRINITY_DN152_c0_g1~~TRINITY_DN152_c0_g1_i1.p1  ORF type:complete len:685 (+),score=163.59 TRINITY_DN152_c0_g1_i1:128-2182(+)
MSSLQGEFESILRQESPLVMLVLDGSGSVEPYWKTFVEGTRLAVSAFRGADICLIQFGTSATIVCSVTSDTDRLLRSINAMVQLKGSTNLVAALQLAINTSYVASSPTQPKIVITITDGEPDTFPTEEVQRLQAMSVRMIGIGIGKGVQHQAIQKMSSPGCAFICEDYAHLNETFAKLTPKQAQEVQLEIEFEPLDSFTCIRDPLSLRIKVTNRSRETIPELLIDFHKGYYYGYAGADIPALPRGDTNTAQITFKPLPNSNEDLFPERLQYTATTKDGKVWKGWVSLATAWIAGDFIFDHPINILVFGRIGSGKSSLITAIMDLFKVDRKRSETNVMVANKGGAHVTTSYEMYPIAHYLKEDHPMERMLKRHIKINLFDTWGSTDTTYKALRLDEFLYGKVPLHYELPSKEAPLPIHFKTQPGLIIHAAIFVVPIQINEDPEYLKIFNQHIEDATRLGWKPLLVITNADQISSADRIQKDAERIVKSTLLGLSDHRVISNYFFEKERNNTKDLPYREILASAVSRAIERTAQMRDVLGYDLKRVKQFAPEANEPKPEKPVEEESKKVEEAPKNTPFVHISNTSQYIETKGDSTPTKKPDNTLPPSPIKQSSDEIEVDCYCNGSNVGIVLLSSNSTLASARVDIMDQINLQFKNFLIGTRAVSSKLEEGRHVSDVLTGNRIDLAQ